MIAFVHLRPAKPSDVDAIVALERATEAAPHWQPKTYATILENGARHAAGDPSCLPLRSIFLAEQPSGEGERLAGFAVGLVHPAEESSDCIAELESVAVDAVARRAGIGRALCGAVIDWCRGHGATEVVLEVRAGSTAAIALYTALGFKQVGRRSGYYHHPEEDALILRLQLERS